MKITVCPTVTHIPTAPILGLCLRPTLQQMHTHGSGLHKDLSPREGVGPLLSQQQRPSRLPLPAENWRAPLEAQATGHGLQTDACSRSTTHVQVKSLSPPVPKPTLIQPLGPASIPFIT